MTYSDAGIVPSSWIDPDNLRGHSLWAELERQTLLKTCCQQVIRATADAARVSDVESGDYVCLQGDADSPLILVLSGQLRKCFASEEGDEIGIRTVAAGESIGEAAIVGDVPIPANIIASRKSTIAMLSRVRARQLFADSEVSRALTRSLAAQVTRFAHRYAQQGLPRAAARISAVIVSEISSADLLSAVELPNHATIAAMANVSRETVSRVLASLERRGVIVKQGRRISIQDRAALRTIAMG
ncbi:CRP-like cAMP-binding protein [Paraburkholderia sp. WSM4175]|uniref:Crp/Fnr family transcriptional regulator n=1 Tax=Paraburkholderia sp. WSM4175 TaxID=2991072 RepID=UPI003D214E57